MLASDRHGSLLMASFIACLSACLSACLRACLGPARLRPSSARLRLSSAHCLRACPIAPVIRYEEWTWEPAASLKDTAALAAWEEQKRTRATQKGNAKRAANAAVKSDAVLGTALVALQPRAEDDRALKKACDCMLIDWMRYAAASAASPETAPEVRQVLEQRLERLWPPALHTISETSLRVMAGLEEAVSHKKKHKPEPPQGAKASTATSSGATSAAAAAAAAAASASGATKERPVTRSTEYVTALGYHPRPKGFPPRNDSDESLKWSYKRGVWVNVEVGS
jgi:hypothetical protein